VVIVGLTVETFAALIGGQVVQAVPATITGVADPVTAGPEHVAFFLENRTPSPTAAGIVVTQTNIPYEGPQAHITVGNPRVAFAQTLRYFHPEPEKLPPVGIHPGAWVDPTAQIDPTARIGPGVYIGPDAVIGADTAVFPGVYIGAGVQVGQGCVFYPQAVLLDRTLVGDRVMLSPGVVIGADGYGFTSTRQGHLKIPQVGRVVLGDDVEVGANTTIDRATLFETRIGRGTKMDNLIQVGHNVQVGEDCLLVAQSGVGGSTKIGDRVILAAQAGIAGINHLEVGADSVIYGRAGVHKSFPAKSKIAGFPAQEHGHERRQQAALIRLPEMLKELRALRKRVKVLEAQLGIAAEPEES